MNKRQQEELKQIANNHIAIGAFSGMIFNASLKSELSTEDLITKALEIRVKAKEMAEKEV